MKKRLVTTLFVVMFLFIVGCTKMSEVSVSEPTGTFGEDPDLSLYVVEAEPSTGPEPVELEDHLNYIDTEELMRLMSTVLPTSTERTAYNQYTPEWDFVLIDSRPAGPYNNAHINGAIHMPDADFENLAHMLPENKDIMLIFYCGGLHCHLSPASANKALDMGYTNVWVYQEGTPFWKAAGNYFVTTPQHVGELIMETYVTDENNGPFMILDSRTYAGYFKEHIPGSIFVDNYEYEKYGKIMPADKNTEIIIYCGGFFCHRSHEVAVDLVADGYTNVKVLAGGMPSWKQAGLPTIGMEASGGGFDVSAGKVNRAITPERFTELFEAGAQVLDVRGPAEVANSGLVTGAINIPDGDINADPQAIADQLPADKSTTIIIHCAAGARASGVVDKIAELGYENTFYLNSSISVNADGTFGF